MSGNSPSHEPSRTAVLRIALVLLGIPIAILLTAAGDHPVHRSPLVFLPGTQVGTVDSAESHVVCSQCHYSPSLDRPVTIHSDWSGSMMAQSARDPVFYAALAVANRDLSSSGEFCIRCHSPTGWLAGHSQDFTGQSLVGTDLDGVQCDYCHRAGDPLNPDSTIPMVVGFPVPGFGNAMFAVQRYQDPKRGPFDSVIAPHPTRLDTFQHHSELCAVCHEVSNPFFTPGRDQLPPYAYAPMERTYSEWLMSSYATLGDSGTCQSCHMPDTTGYACVYAVAPLRADLARHDLTGGNTFVPDILPYFWTGLDTATLSTGKARAEATLRRAAALAVQAVRSGDTVIATVRTTNLTGHKLPTGYPEGRRMWLELTGVDSRGDTVFHSGAFNPDSGEIVPDTQLKIYHAVFGLTDSTATAFNLTAGPSDHFVLNDSIVFDNRIPPKGFTNARFGSRLAAPVGAAYADGQYWDDTHYTLPSTAIEVTASLWYQSIDPGYIRFLRDQNAGNPEDWNSWGSKLYASWSAHGKSSPVRISTVQAPVQNSSAVSGDPTAPTIPLNVELFQNYPNPFNPSTEVSFVISQSSFVRLGVYDVLGRELATLVNERKSPGRHSVVFDASSLVPGGLPSGVYLYSLAAGQRKITKKMLLIR